MDQGEQSGRTPLGPGAFVPGMCMVAVLLAGIALIMDSGRGTDAPSERVNQLILGSLGLATLAILLWLSQRVEPAREEALVTEAMPLCPNCLVPHPEGLHFCATCGAPLTFFAATGSYEAVYARAWILGKAAHAPHRWLHPLGLILYPVLPTSTVVSLLVLFGLPSFLGAEEATFSWLEAVPAILPFGMFAIALALLRLSLLNLRALGDADEGAPARPIYGSPPYWTFDIQGKVALPQEQQDDDAPEA